MAKPLDIVDCFSLDRFKEIGPDRIIPTAKSEVLPDKDTKLVTSIVEDILFIYATSPYSVEKLINIEAQVGFASAYEPSHNLVSIN